MALPIVSGSEVSTPSSGVRMDSSAFRNAALAPGRVAQTVGQDVGGLFQDVSQNIQANRNARTVFDADLAMRKTKDDFTANLAKMPDEGTWLPAYKQQVDQLRDQTLSGPNVGPDVKRVLSQKFDMWEGVTSAEIRQAALLKGATETRESAIADSTYAAHQGDIEGAKNILNAAVAHYAMTPGDVKKISARFPSIAAQAQADTAISTNPIKAPDLIQRFKGTIEPAVFVGIMHRAGEEKSRAQANNLNDLSEQMETSPDGTIDPKLLAEKVKTGDVTQRGADGLLNRMKHAKDLDKKQADLEDRNEASLVALDITDHDFIGDKEPQKSANDFNDRIKGIANPGQRDRLTQRLQNKIQSAQKKGEEEEKPIIKEQLDWMKQNFEGKVNVIPVFGGGHVAGGIKKIQEMTDENFQGTFGKDANRADAVKHASAYIETQRLNYAKKQQAFLAWAHDPSNKDATVEQAQAERQRLERPDVEAQVKQALGGGPVVGKKYKDKDGNVATWDGTKFVPAK